MVDWARLPDRRGVRDLEGAGLAPARLGVDCDSLDGVSCGCSILYQARSWSEIVNRIVGIPAASSACLDRLWLEWEREGTSGGSVSDAQPLWSVQASYRPTANCLRPSVTRDWEELVRARPWRLRFA